MACGGIRNPDANYAKHCSYCDSHGHLEHQCHRKYPHLRPSETAVRMDLKLEQGNSPTPRTATPPTLSTVPVSSINSGRTHIPWFRPDQLYQPREAAAMTTSQVSGSRSSPYQPRGTWDTRFYWKLSTYISTSRDSPYAWIDSFTSPSSRPACCGSFFFTTGGIRGGWARGEVILTIVSYTTWGYEASICDIRGSFFVQVWCSWNSRTTAEYNNSCIRSYCCHYFHTGYRKP